MIPRTKRAASPIRIGYQQVEDVACWFLDNSELDPWGVILGFPEETRVIEVVGPTGEPHEIAVACRTSKQTQLGGQYDPPTKTITVFFNDIVCLISAGRVTTEDVLAGSFKADWHECYWDRVHALVIIIIHELTHAVDPSVATERLSEKTRRERKLDPKIERSPQQWRNYIEAPEEFRARLQEIVYEAAHLLDTETIKGYGDDDRLPTLKELLPRLRTVRELLWFIDEHGAKRKILNQIYSAVYTMMAGRDIDPRTGKKMAALEIPLTKQAGDLITIGNHTTWGVQVWMDGTCINEFDGTRDECWTWAKKQVGQGRRVVLLAVSSDTGPSTMEKAEEVARLGSWPSNGWLEVPAGIETLVRFTSRDGRPFQKSPVKTHNRVDKFMLKDGLPEYLDSEVDRFVSEVLGDHD